MTNLDSLNARLSALLQQKRFIIYSWMILHNKSRLSHGDYIQIDPQSIKRKLTDLGNQSIDIMVNEFINSDMLSIFDRPNNRKFNFIKRILIKNHGNIEKMLPPGVSANSEILYTLYDSLPLGREKKIELIHSINELWNDNAKYDDDFLSWLKKDHAKKHGIIVKKLNSAGKNTQALKNAHTPNDTIEYLDLILKKPDEKLKLLTSAKSAYSQWRAKEKNKQEMKNAGIELVNINIGISKEHHKMFTEIKNSYDITQSEAFNIIVEYYYKYPFAGGM